MDDPVIAATLLPGLMGAISSVWQYYFSVILGLLGLITALAQATSLKLAAPSKIAITVGVVIFGLETATHYIR